MAKRITRIVLTGGPAAGKTTLISRILKEFKQDDGWKVITLSLIHISEPTRPY